MLRGVTGFGNRALTFELGSGWFFKYLKLFSRNEHFFGIVQCMVGYTLHYQVFTVLKWYQTDFFAALLHFMVSWQFADYHFAECHFNDCRFAYSLSFLMAFADLIMSRWTGHSPIWHSARWHSLNSGLIHFFSFSKFAVIISCINYVLLQFTLMYIWSVCRTAQFIGYGSYNGCSYI